MHKNTAVINLGNDSASCLQTGDGILMLGFKFSENIRGHISDAWIQIQQGSFCENILKLGYKYSRGVLGEYFEAWIQIQQGSWGKLDKLPWHEGLTRVLRCAA